MATTGQSYSIEDAHDILESAMEYLKPRADADAIEQGTGEFEAYAILERAIAELESRFACRFCGEPTIEADTCCSKGCARALEAGI